MQQLKRINQLTKNYPWFPTMFCCRTFTPLVHDLHNVSKILNPIMLGDDKNMFCSDNNSNNITKKFQNGLANKLPSNRQN